MPQRIVIEMTDDGQFNVHAPLQDKILCYGLLEAARDVIKDYEPPETRIAVPPAGLIVPRA